MPDIDFNYFGTPVLPTIMVMDDDGKAYGKTSSKHSLFKGVKELTHSDHMSILITAETADYWIGCYIDNAHRPEEKHWLKATHFEKAHCREATEEEENYAYAIMKAYEKIDFSDEGNDLEEPKDMKLEKPDFAFHSLTNLGSANDKTDQWIYISAEKDDYYVGNFLEGYGFINVHFPKENCRELTEEEQEEVAFKKILII